MKLESWVERNFILIMFLIGAAGGLYFGVMIGLELKQ